MNRSPLRRISPKKAAADREWQRVRQLVIRRDVYCQATAMAPGVECWGLASVHHKLRRSQGGENTAANCIYVCGLHHRLIHDHPARAAELGLLVLRGETT